VLDDNLTLGSDEIIRVENVSDNGQSEGRDQILDEAALRMETAVEEHTNIKGRAFLVLLIESLEDNSNAALGAELRILNSKSLTSVIVTL